MNKPFEKIEYGQERKKERERKKEKKREKSKAKQSKAKKKCKVPYEWFHPCDQLQTGWYRRS